jgi:hypothetical protein
MPKSKTRLVAEFMRKVEEDTVTGEAVNTDVKAVETTVTNTITGSLYNSDEIDSMFDDVISEIENIATGV